METQKHSHYFKDVSGLKTIDVYRVLSLFNVTDPCIQHAVKKLLVAGGRGVKNIDKDIQEAIDTLVRWQAIRVEDEREKDEPCFPQPGDVFTFVPSETPVFHTTSQLVYPVGVRSTEMNHYNNEGCEFK